MFKKYHDIENHYREKFINYFLEQYPELDDCIYIAQEKIHGANIQFIFDPEKEFEYGKRTCIVSDDENFYNIQNVIKDYSEVIQIFQSISKIKNITINLYGELFGPGINKGVDYGDKKQIRFFDMSINRKLVNQFEFISMFRSYDIQYLLVPTVSIIKGLDNILKINAERNSYINPTINQNIMEGIVIKPYEKVYVDKVGQIFMIKKKNEKFIEESRTKKIKIKPIEKFSDEVLNLELEFSNYINKNRVESVFSKYGEINEPKEIGLYIGMVTKDAIKDFEKDFEGVKLLSKKETKFIYNASKEIVEILNQYL